MVGLRCRYIIVGLRQDHGAQVRYKSLVPAGPAEGRYGDSTVSITIVIWTMADVQLHATLINVIRDELHLQTKKFLEMYNTVPIPSFLLQVWLKMRSFWCGLQSNREHAAWLKWRSLVHLLAPVEHIIVANYGIYCKHLQWHLLHWSPEDR